jgi:F-type H+-transporting ATPase subunit delta
MMSQRQVQRQAKQLFRLCQVNGLLDGDRARQVVNYVANARYRACPAILARFQRLVQLDRARYTAKIESATPLPNDLLGIIEQKMERRYGPGLTTAVTVSPALIGGIRIQVGSDVYDGSVRAGLAALKRSF